MDKTEWRRRIACVAPSGRRRPTPVCVCVCVDPLQNPNGSISIYLSAGRSSIEGSKKAEMEHGPFCCRGATWSSSTTAPGRETTPPWHQPETTSTGAMEEEREREREREREKRG